MRHLERCCIFSLTALACSAALAEGAACETSPSDTIKVVTLELRDRDRAQARVVIPSNTAVMVVASETAIDAMLEVHIDGEASGVLSDKPLRRRGTQRVVLEA